MVRVISGGQTGVDRAALDVAQETGLECGGWCPRGRRAEDGRIPDHYPLKETRSADYRERTRRNVLEADATLILTRGRPRGGTALTVRVAASVGRPAVVVELASPVDVDTLRRWLSESKAHTLNVAGPRESSDPGIGAAAAAVLRLVLA